MAGQTITLICPEGAWDYPTSHGTTEYFPYPLVIDPSRYPVRENGALWGVDVPIEIYSYFVGVGGYTIMPDPQATTQEVGWIRLRKRDGSYAGCGWGVHQYEPDADGIVTVPLGAVPALTESFGYEVVPQDESEETPAPVPDETPPAEEPPAETPPAEEPPAETPPAEEPPAEVAPVEEAAVETTPLVKDEWFAETASPQETPETEEADEADETDEAAETSRSRPSSRRGPPSRR